MPLIININYISILYFCQVQIHFKFSFWSMKIGDKNGKKHKGDRNVFKILIHEAYTFYWH